MQSTSFEMQDWMNHKWESRLLEDIINSLRNTHDTTLMTESEEELRGFLMRVNEESKKAGLKLNVKKTKLIMASVPIISWQREGRKSRSRNHIFIISKITVDGDCSQEVKRRLLLGKKTYDKPTQHIK